MLYDKVQSSRKFIAKKHFILIWLIVAFSLQISISYIIGYYSTGLAWSFHIVMVLYFHHVLIVQTD